MKPNLTNLRLAVEQIKGTLVEASGDGEARHFHLLAPAGSFWTDTTSSAIPLTWQAGESRETRTTNAASFTSALRQIAAGTHPADPKAHRAAVDMKDYARIWTVGSVTYTATIAPCCWMYGRDLQVMVKMQEGGESGGQEMFFDHAKKFADATPGVVETMTAHIAVVPCKNRGCRRTAFDPAAFPRKAEHGGRNGQCEKCWMAKWQVQVDASQKRQKKKEETCDARMQAKGYTWKIVASIYPRGGGDDYQTVWYTGGKAATTDEKIRGRIAKKSDAEPDFKVTPLLAPGQPAAAPASA